MNRWEKKMVEIGRRIAADFEEIYTPLMMEKMFEGVDRHIPNETPEKKECGCNGTFVASFR